MGVRMEHSPGFRLVESSRVGDFCLPAIQPGCWLGKSPSGEPAQMMCANPEEHARVVNWAYMMRHCCVGWLGWALSWSDALAAAASAVAEDCSYAPDPKQ